jgi:hypothetical protein
VPFVPFVPGFSVFQGAECLGQASRETIEMVCGYVCFMCFYKYSTPDGVGPGAEMFCATNIKSLRDIFASLHALHSIF